MSKPDPPRSGDKTKKLNAKPAAKPNAKAAAGARASRPPEKPTATSAVESWNWEPCTDFKNLMYSKQISDRQIIYKGERVGWNGNREFIYQNPFSGQEFHLYRPPNW